jgi:psp operon transcriptional activator
VNVRIIGATNADLPALCEEGKFKQDLLDRLSFEVLFLPPLRERGEDILTLAYFFASKMAQECDREGMVTFTDEVIDKLMAYRWPGNVRELKNVIERAVYRSEDNVITELQFDPFANPFEEKTGQSKEAELVLGNFEADRIEFEIRYLAEALKQGEGNQKEAAKLLGLTYDQFRGLYRKYQDRL